MSKATSSRIKEAAARRVLDDAARQRRARKALESLEQDNNCDDPHADLVMSKKALSLFQEEEEVGARKAKRRARTTEYYKQRFRKNLAQLLEEARADVTRAINKGSSGGTYYLLHVPVDSWVLSFVHLSYISCKFRVHFVSFVCIFVPNSQSDLHGVHRYYSWRRRRRR